MLLVFNRDIAMDSKNEKVEAVASYAENKLVKEIQGDIDDSPCLNQRGKNRKQGDEQGKMIKEEGEGPKPLPHQQVPQPGDCTSEGLEKL